jgi:hypothetical protein
MHRRTSILPERCDRPGRLIGGRRPERSDRTGWGPAGAGRGRQRPRSVIRAELPGDLAGLILAVVVVHAQRFVLGMPGELLDLPDVAVGQVESASDSLVCLRPWARTALATAASLAARRTIRLTESPVRRSHRGGGPRPRCRATGRRCWSCGIRRFCRVSTWPWWWFRLVHFARVILRYLDRPIKLL